RLGSPPVGTLKLRRQPLEEFGMSRHFSLCAKILGGPHEALAKQVLPNSIHVDPRGETGRSGIFAREPMRERESPSALSLRHGFFANDRIVRRIAQHTEEAGLDDRSRRFELTALEQMRHGRRADIVYRLDPADVPSLRGALSDLLRQFRFGSR